ncbi:hypothetical protein WN982_30320 [Paraburkholderia sp. IMGN_8]|uniref:hypothetical protein n=1 Tax=Paraburkholderia sp. IMGN_8 TaxID=3136564 RepID=UPI0031019DB3
MSYDHETEQPIEEVGSLLKALIEVGLSQNALLSGLSRKLDTAICILEHVSKNTCETLNEIHSRSDSRREFIESKESRESKESCKECCTPPHPTALTYCEVEEPTPYCKYEPCEPREEGGGTAISLVGSAAPQRAFGAPFPPAASCGSPDEEANEVPAPDVPRGPFRGFLTPGKPIKPLDIRSGGAAGGDPDPVVFGKYTIYGKGGTPKSTVAADISGAESGSVVLATANKYVAYSTDAGSTFTPLDPTTIFDNTADGGFCCDQIVQYVPSIDRFIWLMQFNVGANGKNRLRIAAASPETVSSSKCTSWTYWDLTSDALGITTTAADAAAGNHWLDYPNMSVGNNFLYMSVDNVGNGGASPPTGGRIIVRIPLPEIAAAGTINFRYTDWANSGIAYASHVTQNTGDEAYWAGNKNNSTLQVFNWNENSTSYSWRDVGVNNWPNATLTSIAKDNNDWLTKAASFPNFGVIGATRRGNEVWFAWTASNGAGASGGFNFPNANIQVVKIDPSAGYKLLDQFAIWNNDYAFAYPSLATNDRGEVGIALGWGGKTFYANSAVGILGDFVVWYPALSDISTTRWGDYVTVRQASPQNSLFAGFGYSILTDATTAAGYRFDPFYILFGRNSIINPGGGGIQ